MPKYEVRIERTQTLIVELENIPDYLTAKRIAQEEGLNAEDWRWRWKDEDIKIVNITETCKY